MKYRHDLVKLNIAVLLLLLTGVVSGMSSPDSPYQITSSCLSVSSEDLQFTEVDDQLFVAHDSIGFDAICKLRCIPTSSTATVEEIGYTNPYPGLSDTAVFKITTEDGAQSELVKVVVSRSMYLTKFGILDEITDKTSEFDGWTFGGNRYPTSSKGNGGTYPGEKAMRIYQGNGRLTTPQFSSVSTLQFVAKFSKSDGELLKVQKSYDGVNYSDVHIYTPGEGTIPVYDGESIDDPLSETQTLSINDKNVYIRFKYVSGNTDSPRTMIDDIACLPIYDPSETFEVLFIVKDFYNNMLEGAMVKMGDDELLTDSKGEAFFTGLPSFVQEQAYSVTKSDYLDRSGSLLVKSDMEKKVYLSQEELEIFLALGQSNMAGRADIEGNTDPIPGAYLLSDEDVWIPAVNPMNLYSNIRKSVDIQKLGPSYAFARTLSNYVDHPICMITNARGGTSITQFSAGGDYHLPMMERISKANDFGTVKGIIWHQGESNSSSYGTYLEKLNSLVEEIRETVHTDAYFLAGQLGPWDGKYEGFNTNLTRIQNFIDKADYVHNKRIEHLGDETHFNTPSQLLLGTRYAQYMLEEIYQISICIYEFTFSEDLVVSHGNNTISDGERVLYTTLWEDDLRFMVHAPDGQQFDTLMINGIVQNLANAGSTYEFLATSRDSLFSIEATFQEETTNITGDFRSSLSFHPNPTSGKIIFKGGDGTYTSSLFDMSGRMILAENRSNEMDLSSMKSGYYILHLHSGNKTLSKPLQIR